MLRCRNQIGLNFDEENTLVQMFLGKILTEQYLN